ncbi:MAG: hypothetical protein U1F33_13070 [Alphaproteobacteria bacterium]
MTVTLANPAPNLARLANGAMLTGTVIGPSGNGTALIATAEGPIRLPMLPGLIPGSTLRLEIATNGPRLDLAILSVRAPEPAATTSGIATETASARDLEDASLIHRWPALETARTGAAAGLPIPRPGPGLAPAIARLVTALGHGEIDQWIDHGTLRAIEANQGEPIAARLREDFAFLGGLASHKDAEDWRLFALPFLHGGALQQVQLFLRRHDHGQEDGGSTCRFLLQLSTSPFGWLQLDGLIDGRRFDLILRSEKRLPEALREELARLFVSATAGAGYVGRFESSGEQTVSAPPAANTILEGRGVLV